MTFGRLVRSAKVSHYNSPEHVLTADTAYHHRGLFGLKQPVKGANKYIRVHSADTSKRQAGEATYGMSLAANFVRRWDELQTQIAVAPSAGAVKNDFVVRKAAAPANGPNWVASVYDSNVAQARDTRPPPANVFAMSKRQFARFVRNLTPRDRDEFAQFLQASNDTRRITRNSSTNMANSYFPSSSQGALLLSNAQQPAAMTHALMNEFLAKKRPDTQAPTFHAKLGLQYSHPTVLESYFTPRVPGHVIERAAPASASKAAELTPADIARRALGRDPASHTVSVMSQVAKTDSPLPGAPALYDTDNGGFAHGHASARFLLKPTLTYKDLVSQLARRTRALPDEYRVLTKSSLPDAFRTNALSLAATHDPSPVPVPGSLEYMNKGLPAAPRPGRSKPGPSAWERTQFKKWA